MLTFKKGKDQSSINYYVIKTLTKLFQMLITLS